MKRHTPEAFGIKIEGLEEEQKNLEVSIQEKEKYYVSAF